MARVLVIADHVGSHPNSVVDSAIKAVADRKNEAKNGIDDEFEEVWIVFDTEGQQNPRYAEARSAVDRSRSLNFKTAVSNPSFEFWLLLHFEYYVQTIPDGAAVCKLLKKHLPQFAKGKDPYPHTKEKIETARDNARRLLNERGEQRERTHPCDQHPCTQVHLLLKSLLE